MGRAIGMGKIADFTLDMMKEWRRWKKEKEKVRPRYIIIFFW